MAVPDDLYERMAMEAMRSLLGQISIEVIREVGWSLFIGDVFDLTDAICAELLVRQARNKEEAT